MGHQLQSTCTAPRRVRPDLVPRSVAVQLHLRVDVALDGVVVIVADVQRRRKLIQPPESHRTRTRPRNEVIECVFARS
jgi:hypothetical protein